jgi:hypothetical protein
MTQPRVVRVTTTDDLEIRSTVTGHRVSLVVEGQLSRRISAPRPTREMPFWVWPFELAARVRAKMERRYGGNQ